MCLSEKGERHLLLSNSQERGAVTCYAKIRDGRDPAATVNREKPSAVITKIPNLEVAGIPDPPHFNVSVT